MEEVEEATLQPLVHPPLPKGADALRLLILPPKGKGKAKGKENKDKLSFELFSKSFADKPVYECLSYTWGDGVPDKEITINGQSFKVRKNLYNALQHLQQKTPRTLWIDAICINQSDVEERNAQVSLMAFIYRRATRVVVWLGLSPVRYTSLDREVMYIQREENSKSIILNPYWGRLWIIQELVLAQEVHFVHGNLEFEWNEVDQLLAHSVHWNTLEERIRPLIEHRDQRDTEEYRLELLLDKFKNAQSSEPKDKIYGFLGISHDGDEDEIEVDYSIKLFDLYKKMINFHQESPPVTRNMFDDDIVPEFDRSVQLIKFSSLIQGMFGGDVETEARAIDFNNHPKRFYYGRGALAGEILYIGPTYTETISTFKANKTWKKNLEKLYASGSGHDLAELRREDLAYSKEILDWDKSKLAKIRNVNSTSSFGFRYAAEDDDILLETPGEDEGAATGAEAKPEEEQEADEPRRFLATNSRIGFAPSNARVGDFVYNFWDCDVAVVLRKVGDEFSDRWKIIGKANLSCSDLSEYSQQKIATEALNCATTEFAGLEEALRDEDFLQMITLKMDIDVLQRLTC